MIPYHSDDRVTVHHGDCLDAMRELPDCSVDSIVTDPPYGLGFMGREWDALPPGLPWAQECLRVLKPGGHLLAFGGTRTWHRLAVAVEDAGFEIRDSIAWMYGSGFPKSLDVSKAIDKAAGAEREVVERWQGCGTALKPAFEPIVVARKPLVGTVAANVLAHGTGALNIDGCRVATDWDTDPNRRGWQGRKGPDNGMFGQGEARADFSQPNALGRWPANVILDESQATALDEQAGELTSGKGAIRTREMTSKGYKGGGLGQRKAEDHDFTGDLSPNYGDSGGASRFFYVAKADASERVRVDGISHPTVKPLALMRWLVRLVTPPGGTVLEPFAGSGTTVEACILEGFQCIAIEREADYLPLIVQRINRRRDPVAAVKGSGGELGLFDLLDGGAA